MCGWFIPNIIRIDFEPSPYYIMLPSSRCGLMHEILGYKLPILYDVVHMWYIQSCLEKHRKALIWGTMIFCYPLVEGSYEKSPIFNR